MENKVINMRLLAMALLAVITYGPWTGCSSNKLALVPGSNKLALIPVGDQTVQVKTPTVQEAQTLANSIIRRMSFVGDIGAAALAKVRQFKDAFINPMIEQFNEGYAAMKNGFDAASGVALEKFNSAKEKLDSINQQLVAKLRSLKEQCDACKVPVVAVATSVAQVYNAANEANDAKTNLNKMLEKIQTTVEFKPDEKKELLGKIVDSTSKINSFVKVFDDTVLENLSKLMSDPTQMVAIREALKGYQDTFEAIQYLVSNEEINLAVVAAQKKRLQEVEKIKKIAAMKAPQQEGLQQEEQEGGKIEVEESGTELEAKPETEFGSDIG